MSKDRLPAEWPAPPGAVAENTALSRRGLLFGLSAGILGLTALSASTAQAAVSMLRSGVDPDLIDDGEGDVVEVRRWRRGPRWGWGWGWGPGWRRRRWRRRRGVRIYL